VKWFKVWCAILSSTLVEEAGAAGVGTWTLILSLAANDKTPGKFRFKSINHLARIFNMEPQILEQHLKIFEKTKRIKIKRFEDEIVLRVLKWQEYQQNPKDRVDTHNQQKNKKVDTQNHPRGEENREERKEREEEKREESREEKNNPLKEQFFSLLKSFPSYPFQEEEDNSLFDHLKDKIDILEQTKRKIDWWRQNPEASKSKKKSPRQQLIEFFLEELEFQNQR
jgi:hypothetical protein